MSKLARGLSILYLMCTLGSTYASAMNNYNYGENVHTESKIENQIALSEITEVAKTNLVEATTTEEVELKKHGQVVNIKSHLIVRELPSKDSKCIIRLHNGNTFDILTKVNEWYHIQYKNSIGYVHENYVEEYNETPPYEEYKEPEVTTVAIKAELTAYCNCLKCSSSPQHLTAMGTTTRLGVIAAPKTIALGTQVYIPDLTFYKSDGIFSVEDRGGAIKVKADGTHIIDVWFPSHEKALEFGRRQATIYLMK